MAEEVREEEKEVREEEEKESREGGPEEGEGPEPEKEEVSAEPQAEEQVPPEPPPEPSPDAEKIIEALEEEERKVEAPAPKEEKKAKGWLGKVFLILGMLVVLGAIGAGAFVLWNMLRSPAPLSVQEPSVSVPKPPSQETKVSPKPLEKEPTPTVIPVEPYEYALSLRKFLIPLQSEGGAPVFVKATVVLYFNTQKEVKLAKKLESPFRGIIFDTLKQIPFYYWRTPEGIKRIKEAVLKVLKENAPQGLVPADVQVTGYILK